MKGKLTKLMMVAMMLVTVFGLAASLATVSSTATVAAATDKWSRMDLPTTLNYQMLPDSNIWDLTAAADGTLFALVEDTTGPVVVAAGVPANWDGLRWAVYPAYSDIAVFKSTDGGYSWSLMWHVPSSETGAPIAVVPQPGYTDGDSAKDVVFVAMGSRYITGLSTNPLNYAGGLSQGNIYRSMDGAANFTRVTPRCPAVTLTPAGLGTGGTITSMDVAENPMSPGTYMAIVGVSSIATGGFIDPSTTRGEGVYTWNQNNTMVWLDLQISNAVVIALGPPMPGTMPAGNGLDVIQVMASRNFTTDGCIVAVANDIRGTGHALGIDPAGENMGIYVCFYDANDGIWGGDIDSPTTATRYSTVAVPAWATNPAGVGVPDYAGAASMDTGTDFNNVTSCYVFVGIDGDATTATNNDLWRIRGLATVTGPSTTLSCNVGILTAYAGRISDVMLNSDASNPQTAAYVGCQFPAGQAQELNVYNLLNWPGPVPSFKPTSGAWPVFITDMAGIVMAAGGGDGATTSGVHKAAITTRGLVYNGVGLMDDIAVSENIPGLASAATWAYGYGTWCLAEAVSEEVSPTYETDGLIYVGTYSDWGFDQGVAGGSLSLWRLTDGNWERIMYEGIILPDMMTFDGKPMTLNVGIQDFVNPTTWWPRVVPQFSTDGTMFLMGGRTDIVPGGTGYREMIWTSPDKGNDWRRLPQMPIGALGWGGAFGLVESGWWVQDSNTLFIGDDNGWIYKTTNRGASWTDGALTGVGLEIDMIRTSPIYSEAGTAGTDKCLIVGTYDQAGFTDEVWLSQDGAIKDLENIGDEIYSSPSWVEPAPFALPALGGTAIAFDKNWATNKIVYAAGGGWLDRWQMVGVGAGGTVDLNRIDYTDVCVVRTAVDITDPSASTWEDLWVADDYSRISPDPQPLTAMGVGDSIYRTVNPSDIQIGADGTVYVTFSVWDSSYNNGGLTWIGLGDTPSPNLGGRYTMSGVLRCLDGTLKTTEWEVCQDGRGTWDGLWLNRAVVGNTHLISLTWDWKEWRFKLAFWEDTLSGAGPAPVSPLANATGVGALMSDTSVSVPLSWQAKGGATQYQWQVSEDSAFSAANTVTGETSDLTVTVPDLKASTTYYWRSRALEPMLGRWNTAQQFTTVIGGETGAPKLITPAKGATISDAMPLFTWEKIASATNYEIQVSTSPEFGTANLVINEELGNVDSYAPDKDLVNGKYYWQVRGTNPTTDTKTPFSSSSFTLDTAAGGEGTPVWVWVLIVLGVLLGIIVLVLILRTRRPV